MTDESGATEQGARRGERRQRDRRRSDRRAPQPLWRRPWAYAGYGLAGGLLLVALFTGIGRDEPRPEAGEVTTGRALPAVDSMSLPASDRPVVDAFDVGGYERLLAQGSAAAGQRVNTVLYCDPIRPVSLMNSAVITPAVAKLSDSAGRVPASECKWGGDPNAPDFLLLIPPDLAERFAATREMEMGFVRRRRVPAEIEWIGRSDALALRIVGLLGTIQNR